MDKLPLAVTAVALGLTGGAIVYQAFFVAASVFRVLPDTAARAFLRDLFPRFFRFNALWSATALLGLIADAVLSGYSTITAWCIAGAAGMTFAMVSASLLVPAINAARDAGDAGSARFRSLHRLSVLLTLFALTCAIAILLAIGAAARASGA